MYIYSINATTVYQSKKKKEYFIIYINQIYQYLITFEPFSE